MKEHRQMIDDKTDSEIDIERSHAEEASGRQHHEHALASILGPAFVAAVAYVDPGNVAANITSGARYGYLLVWVLVLANAMSVLIQYQSAKLGIVTGKSLPELLGERMSNAGRFMFFMQAEVIAIATDLAEVIGGAIALNLLFGLPLFVGGLVIGAASTVMLWFQGGRTQTTFERIIIVLLLVITFGFIAGLFVAPPNPQTLVRQPPVPLTDPLRDQTQAKGQSSLAGADADDSPTNLFWARFWRVTRKVALYGSPLWTLLIACGLILMFKAILLARARRHGSPKARVAAGWNAIRMLAEQSGITAKGTRRDQAGAIARQLGTDDQALIQLGREADYATFSGQDIESGQATTYWTGVDQLRKAMLASLPRFRRIRTRLSLKSVAILSNGHAAKPHTTHVKRTRKRGKAS